MSRKNPDATSRRRFLKTTALAVGASTCPFQSLTAAADGAGADLVAGVDHEIIFKGRKSGTTWFHPRACMVPGGDGPLALMTLQSIGGSDYFGHVHFTTSADNGKSWSAPEPIDGLGRTQLDSGYSVGVCDVMPEFHPATKCMLAMGHNVYYQGGRLAKQRECWPVYTVRSPEGKWSPPRKLAWDDKRGSAIYTCGCAQRATLHGGDILVPLSFGPKGRAHRGVATVRCMFDGERLVAAETGNELTNTATD